MSANNQILVKKHKEKWYVFDNMNAESWDEKNELTLDEAEEKTFEKREDAILFAYELEQKGYGTEYGVGEYLIKDGADVTIKE